MHQSMNIAWWVQRWSELYPDKRAILFEDRLITYSDLHQRTDKTACWLQSTGIEKGDRVAVLLRNCPEMIELYLGCCRLGAIFVPINFRLEAPEVDFVIRNVKPRVLVFGAEYSDVISALNLDQNRAPIFMATLGKVDSKHDCMDYVTEVSNLDGQRPVITGTFGPADPEEAQVIMYTSGTTGDPKGAVLSHRKTFFNCLNADIFFKMHIDDNMLIVLPLCHSGGLFIQTAPIIYKGATMIIHSKFDPIRVYEDMNRFKVTKFLGVPTVYRALLEVKAEREECLSALKVCAIGGEKTTPELLAQCKEAGFPLRQIMGQTETSILLWASEEDWLKKEGTVGRPVFHAEVNLMDRNDKPVLPGEIGEIVVRGSIMMTEYWQDVEKTRETIRNGWLHTGDLAYMDEDGYYYLVDRAKDMYISGGENVYPAQVEKILRSHPKIEDIAIICIPDGKWGEVGHAYVIPKKGTNVSLDDILGFCDGQLARYKWPKKVSICTNFPRTTLGKVRKEKLRKGIIN